MAQQVVIGRAEYTTEFICDCGKEFQVDYIPHRGRGGDVIQSAPQRHCQRGQPVTVQGKVVAIREIAST
jgi:hypothetical protein